MSEHDWHMFDVELGLEVRRIGDMYEVRSVNNKLDTKMMSADQFDKVRQGLD